METFAVDIIRKLRERDFSAFFAGGCVRDRILGKTPKDFDVATSATPDEVREVFGRRRTLAIGASFGVITVLGPKPLQVEVATFRNDGQYSDGRHPDGVTFSTAEEDAKRRDFTINGMFYDPLEERLIDYVGGEEDLKAGTIRAIGEPLARITEDRLRMLRAVRFAATYGFEIEPITMGAIQSQAQFLVDVSQERITGELMRMLGHPNRCRALGLLKESNLLPLVLRPFEQDLSPPRWSRLLRILDSGLIDTPVVALAAILGTDGMELAAEPLGMVSRSLKLSNEDRGTVGWISLHRPQLEAADTAKLSKLQPLLIQPQAKSTLALMEAVAQVDGSSMTAIQRCHDFLSQSDDQRDPDPLLRGEDLMELGMRPGPQFSQILAAVRDAQVDGDVANREDAISLAQLVEAKLRD